MSDALEKGGVLPSPRILKTVGILNIVFATALILFGLCMGLYLAMLPAFGKAMTQVQKQAQTAAEERRKSELEALEAEEKIAATEEEKQDLQEKRRAIESRPAVPVTTMDFTQMGFTEPRMVIYTSADLGTALVLDILMIVAGVGLIQRRLWGLKLGIWTAALKIVRLVAFQSVFALVVAPDLADKMGKMVGTMMIEQQKAMGRQAPAAFDPAMFVRTYQIMFTVSAVGMIVFGSIYPAISLWLLTRPGARAACDELAPPGLELNETW